MARRSTRFLASVTLLFVPATWVAGREPGSLAPAQQKQIEPARKSSGTIVFSKHHNIWTIEFDGTNPTQLTRTEINREANSEPRLSPDGKKIAFSRFQDSDWRIYTMDADGTNVKRITNHYGRHPAWSPDGTKIAFRRGFRVMDADGKNVQQLTTAPTWSPPSWRVDGKYPDYDRFPSPDGKHVVFTSRGSPRQIYTMDPDGKHMRRLTNKQGVDLTLAALKMKPRQHFASYEKLGETCSNPTWSPDGKHIAFQSTLTEVHKRGPPIFRFTIHVMDHDGKNRRFLTEGHFEPLVQ